MAWKAGQTVVLQHNGKDHLPWHDEEHQVAGSHTVTCVSADPRVDYLQVGVACDCGMTAFIAVPLD